jgi:type II secretory pathway component PulF
MPLSLREKETFYRSLGQLLRTGSTFPKALDNLSRSMRGAARSFARRLHRNAEGQSVAETFAGQRSDVSEMELGTLAAVERAGKLEHGCAQLAEHFRSLATAREAMLRKSAYPIFVLHFAILVFALPKALSGGGVDAYVRQTLTAFGCVYGVGICIALALPLLRDLGATSALLDRLLRAVPLFGKVRRAFAVARFCGTYQMQLDAGVNVLDALAAAGRSSRSGMIRSAVRRALPEVRGGGQVGPMLAHSGAFPDDVGQAICNGEETGSLDEELQRLAGEYQQEGLTRLDTVSEWVPRMVMLGIFIYVGYGIVTFYAGYLKQVEQLVDQIK